MAVFFVVFFAAFAGCNKKPNWTKTLKQNDADPYGTEIFYKTIPKYFPEAQINELKSPYPLNKLDVYRNRDTAFGELLVLVSSDFHITIDELSDIERFIRAGKDVYIFSTSLDYTTCHRFCIQTQMRSEWAQNNFVGEKNFSLINVPKLKFPEYSTFLPFFVESTLDSMGRNKQDTIYVSQDAIPISEKGQIEAPKVDSNFGQTRDTIYYESSDSNTVPQNDTTSYSNDDEENTELLAVKSIDSLGALNGRMNFVRLNFKNQYSGKLYFNCSPEITTNHFLLQDSSLLYLNGIWQFANKKYNYINLCKPESLGEQWRNSSNNNGTLPKMFFFLLLATVFYVLSNYRRRQRAIPVVPKLKNESAAFVETVGQLYYNKGNHHNLALKICNQFLEWVRSKYFIPTTEINDEFAMTLHKKSGVELEHAKEITNIIYEVQSGGVEVNESYLQHLYVIVNKFYKNRD